MKRAALIAIVGLASTASADVLLEVDLSVTNQITITATGGLSAATVSGFQGIGFYLADFFNGPSGAADTYLSGDLSSAENASNGTPSLYTAVGGFGLNVYNYTVDPISTFTAGTVAFAGYATWAINPFDYPLMLAGNTSGDIYFAVDNDADIPNATFLGTWSVVPAPSSLALIVLGGLAAGRRRR